MLDRLQYIKQRFDEISDLIIQPDVISDQKRYVQLNKEYKDLKGLVEKREEYIAIDGNIKEANEIISDGADAEMVEMANMIEAQRAYESNVTAINTTKQMAIKSLEIGRN
jgi:peptide chain release factor 1